jgi:NADH-quinone oxidoreductase subunit J
MQLAWFTILGAIAIASAITMVAKRNSVHSALSLALVALCLAGLYAMLDAHFVWIIQIIIYVGAVMVLFLFVVMHTRIKAEGKERDPIAYQRWLAVLLGLILFVLVGVSLTYAALQLGPATGPPAPPQDFGTAETMGKLLFTNYLLPFELTSVLLIVAIVGAVILARKGEP